MEQMMADLITKNEYKTYAGISSTNQDAEIDSLIPKISQLVKTYCKRSFIDYYSDAKQEVFSGGFNSVILKESPVVQVLSFETSTDYGQNYTELVEFTDWVLDGDYIVSISPQGFERRLNGYRATYYAGYEAVPEDLKLALLDLVTYYRRNDGSVHNNRTPGGGGSVQLEYILNNNFPSHIKRVLDLYVADYA